jgi:hypothetical protein
VQLNEIKSSSPTLKLSNGNEFALRLLNLGDEIWLKENYPTPKDFERLFGSDGDTTTIKDEDVLRVIYHQISDKYYFKAEESFEIDENGEEISIKVGGINKLKLEIAGPEDAIALFQCLIDLFVQSRPTPEEGGKKKLLNQNSGI